MLVLSSYIRHDDLPQNTKKRKGTFRSLCASGRIVFHFHGRIPPCLSNVETILSQKNLFIKSSCALLRPFFAKRDVIPRLLLSSLAVSCEPGFTPQAARCTASCKIPVSKHRETGICSCLLQSNPCEIFLCFAKVFGQPLKTTHRVVFLTLSFKSLLLSDVKQKRTK